MIDKEYINNKKLEMLGKSIELGKKRNEVIAQGNQLQAMLNSVNAELVKLDNEVNFLTELESELEG